MNTPAPKTSPDAALGNLMAAALDVPAPAEPPEVPAWAPDNTLARTGNTADHQAGGLTDHLLFLHATIAGRT